MAGPLWEAAEQELDALRVSRAAAEVRCGAGRGGGRAGGVCA